MPAFDATLETDRNPHPFIRAATFLATPVCIVTGRSRAGDAFAMTAGSVFVLSENPALLALSIRAGSALLPELVDSAAVAVHVLRDCHAGLARAFGQPASAAAARDLPVRGDAPLIEDALARFECAVRERVPAGDHVLVILTVRRVETGVGSPLVHWRRGLHPLTSSHDFLESEATFHSFVAEWEAGTLAPARWTHAAHVAVAAHYAVSKPESAYEVMRAGILRFNDAAGTPNTETSGYHETLTRFWSHVVGEFCATGGYVSSFEAARAATVEFGSDRDLFRMFYDFDVVADRTARREWVAPPG